MTTSANGMISSSRLQSFSTITGALAARLDSRLLILLTILALELFNHTVFHIPSPAAILVIVVVYVAFRDGLRAGLVSAAITCLYMTYYMSMPEQPFRYTEEGGQRLVVWVIVTPAIAFMVGRLNQEFVRRTRQLETETAERLKIYQRMQDSEDALRHLAENRGLIYWVVALNSHDMIYLSPNFSEIWGWDREELLKQPLGFLESVHPEDRPRFREYEAKCHTAVDQEIEYRIVWPDGTVRWIKSQSLAIRNEQGEVYRLVGISEDITVGRQIEQDLRESQAFNQQVLSMTPDLVYVYDFIEHRQVFANRDLGELLGYTPEQFKAIDGTYIPNLIHPDDQKVAFTDVERRFAAEDRVVESEYRIRRGNGEWRWFYSRDVVFSRKSDGRLWQVVGVAHDINERKQLEKQNLELTLQKANIRLLSDFIRDTSHDLRTPLSTINTSVYLLRKGGDPNQQEARLDTIESQVQALTELIEQLHTMSQLDTSMEFAITPIAINTLVEDIYTGINRWTRGKALTVALQLDPDLPDVSGDRGKMNLALMNLVENAVLYTPEDGTITIRTYRHAAELVVEVQDTGIGISDHDLPHIFDRFYKADKARTSGKGGAGLGLSMVKKVIEMHGGNIEVETRLGEGSLFRVRLPADQQSSGEAVA